MFGFLFKSCVGKCGCRGGKEKDESAKDQDDEVMMDLVGRDGQQVGGGGDRPKMPASILKKSAKCYEGETVGEVKLLEDCAGNVDDDDDDDDSGACVEDDPGGGGSGDRTPTTAAYTNEAMALTTSQTETEAHQGEPSSEQVTDEESKKVSDPDGAPIPPTVDTSSQKDATTNVEVSGENVIAPPHPVPSYRSRRIQRFTVVEQVGYVPLDVDDVAAADETAQLTVSSINTVLEDLPETDDEDHDHEEDDAKAKEAKEKRRKEKQEAKQLAAAMLSATKPSKPKTRPPLTNRAFLDKATARAAAKAAAILADQPSHSPYSTVIGLPSESRVTTTPSSKKPVLKRQKSSSDAVPGQTTSSASSPQQGESSTTSISTRRSKSRERSPCVSFDETPTFVEPSSSSSSSRQRSRSDAYRFKFRSLSLTGTTTAAARTSSGGSSGSLSSVGSKSKMLWLRDKSSREKDKEQLSLAMSKALAEDGATGRDEAVHEEELKATSAARKSLTSSSSSKGSYSSGLLRFRDRPKDIRPRTRSDKLDRSARKAVIAEVSKSSAFDWPLGRIGKLKQKYRRKEKDQDLQRSASASAMTSREVERLISSNLRRQHSERNKRGRSVGFEDQQQFSGAKLAASLWTASLKFLLGDSSSSRSRRRHYTDPGLPVDPIVLPYCDH